MIKKIGFAIILSILFFSINAFAEKVCPIDQEVFPDNFNFCAKHGAKLVNKEKLKISTYTVDDNKDEMEFKGFNANCDGYGNEGIKYTENRITITIPWKDVSYILPLNGKAFLKNGRTIETENLKPSSCEQAFVSQNRRQKVTIAGYEKETDVDINIRLEEIEVIAFDKNAFELGIDVAKEERSLLAIKRQKQEEEQRKKKEEDEKGWLIVEFVNDSVIKRGGILGPNCDGTICVDQECFDVDLKESQYSVFSEKVRYGTHTISARFQYRDGNKNIYEDSKEILLNSGATIKSQVIFRYGWVSTTVKILVR